MSQKNQTSTQFYEKYQIQSQIGRGASGIVYKIKKISDGKIYALKKISSNSIKKNNIKGAYTQVAILSSLSHPNIVQYYQSFMDDNDLYIVMQYASKGDLHSILKKRKIKQQFFQQNQIWVMIRQLLNALQYLHNKNIIHRDVKTLNIFLDENNKAIIGDLGVSKILKSDLGLYSRVGTPLYLAPQIIKYQKYDFKADVWGLGCVAYLMTTLSHPFQGKNIISLGQNIVNTNPKPIDKYSQNLNNLIFDMLQKNHLKRLSTSSLVKKYFSGNQKFFNISKNENQKKEGSILLKDIQKIQASKLKQNQIETNEENKSQKKFLVQKKTEKQVQLMKQINKMQFKGVQNLRYEKKINYMIGNFVNEGYNEQNNKIEKKFIKEKDSVVPQSKNFQNTIVIKPKKSIKAEEEQFGNPNQQVTKCQNQNIGFFKKPFQSQHNLKERDFFSLQKGQISQKKLQTFNYDIKQKQSFSKVKSNNLIQFSQSFFPYNSNKFQTLQTKNQPSLNKKNIISIRKMPTEVKNSEQFENLRNQKQYSVMQLNSQKCKLLVRNSKQEEGYEIEDKKQGMFIDIFKITSQTGQRNECMGVGRYRQRPKSSIGKKQKITQSSSIKPKRKENLYSNFYSMVQTKILKKPEVIML